MIIPPRHRVSKNIVLTCHIHNYSSLVSKRPYATALSLFRLSLCCGGNSAPRINLPACVKVWVRMCAVQECNGGEPKLKAKYEMFAVLVFWIACANRLTTFSLPLSLPHRSQRVFHFWFNLRPQRGSDAIVAALSWIPQRQGKCNQDRFFRGVCSALSWRLWVGADRCTLNIYRMFGSCDR